MIEFSRRWRILCIVYTRVRSRKHICRWFSYLSIRRVCLLITRWRVHARSSVSTSVNECGAFVDSSAARCIIRDADKHTHTYTRTATQFIQTHAYTQWFRYILYTTTQGIHKRKRIDAIYEQHVSVCNITCAIPLYCARRFKWQELNIINLKKKRYDITNNSCKQLYMTQNKDKKGCKKRKIKMKRKENECIYAHKHEG